MKFSMISSLLHILCLSFERLLSIRFPMYHRNYIDKKKTCLVLFLIWFISIIPALDKTKISTFLKVLATLMLTCNFVLIPVYIYIYIAVRRTVKTTTLRGSSTLRKHQPTKLERKSTFICSAIVLSFLVCTFPPIVHIIVITRDYKSYKNENGINMLMSSLVVLRSLCDPLVYILRKKVYLCCKKTFSVYSTAQQVSLISESVDGHIIIKDQVTTL